METMIYLCRAERQGRMIAVAIRPESLYKNECPIEGHPFLPNDKPGILPIHLVGKCERKQGATEKVSYVSVWIENKCSPFQYGFKNCLLFQLMKQKSVYSNQEKTSTYSDKYKDVDASFIHHC